MYACAYKICDDVSVTWHFLVLGAYVTLTSSPKLYADAYKMCRIPTSQSTPAFYTICTCTRTNYVELECSQSTESFYTVILHDLYASVYNLCRIGVVISDKHTQRHRQIHRPMWRALTHRITLTTPTWTHTQAHRHITTQKMHIARQTQISSQKHKYRGHTETHTEETHRCPLHKLLSHHYCTVLVMT